jgi:superfamily II DNA or RNA helicase
MFLYILSNPSYYGLSIVKLGCTTNLYNRLQTYKTSCPPGMIPSSDLEYIAVWETISTNQEELLICEDILHNRFRKYRLIRQKPGDTEWFNFNIYDPLDIVNKFLETCDWIKRQISLDEICYSHVKSKYLCKQYDINTSFIRTQDIKNVSLDTIQKPIIVAINEFTKSKEVNAGYVISPSGSGKTFMACRGIRGLKKIIICCPSNQIQMQWRDTIQNEYSDLDILIVGSGRYATINVDHIKQYLQRDNYCIIITYMSSYLLVDLINETTEILILDEAHHLSGIVASEQCGEGITRKLMMNASTLNIKRLSLTYTPRFIRNDDNINIEYLTMDDNKIFGHKIGELKIRDLISKGVLPDYRIWTIQDEKKKGTGLRGKIECIIEAFNATEIVHEIEKFILHHLIIFTFKNDEAEYIEKYLNDNINKIKGTEIIRVQGGDNLIKPIKRFETANRAILINCKVLGEGVDIPIANAVVITYPKQSKCEITQMILRPGRWYVNKPVFHILLPIIDDEDMSGIEYVLTSLASCDELLKDEIVLHTIKGKKDDKQKDKTTSIDEGNESECLIIDEYDGSNLDDIKNCFTRIRKNLFSSKESKEIQQDCLDKKIDTSIEYKSYRSQVPELPEDPRPKKISWYDYLHPFESTRYSFDDFINNIIKPKNIQISYMYDEWYLKQSIDIQTKIPSLQHISDGYFGNEYTEFNLILESFREKVSGRRR